MHSLRLNFTLDRGSCDQIQVPVKFKWWGGEGGKKIKEKRSLKLFPSVSAPDQCENRDVQMGSGQYKPNKLSQLLGQECLAVFVYLRDSFF